MNNVTYDIFPLLLHASFTVSDAPKELPFAVLNEEMSDYLATCRGFQEMLPYIASRNTIFKRNTNTHFNLTESLFYRIDSDDQFRNTNFRKFFTEYIKPKTGVIIFKEGGQYLYTLMGVQDTKKLKKRDGRYIAVSLFLGDNFVGFEEGYITEKGIKVEQTGYYSDEMDVGGYISFILITLAYAGNKDHPLVETATNEKIYQL